MTAKRKLTDFIPDPHNANKGTVRGTAMLEDSLRHYGAGRSILVDRNNQVIAGNKTLASAVDIGLDEALVVPTDGKQLVVVQRTDIDLDSKQGRELAIADNRTTEVSLDWDAAELAALADDGVDLAQFWDADELAALLAGVGDEPAGDGDTPGDIPIGVPDAVWPTDNEWGVPLLDIKLQADAVDQPFLAWGAKGSRLTKQHGGTYHFYTEDYRFEALWADPAPVVESGVITVVEPNFSVYENMPRAVTLWQIYRKRWIARFWQAHGLRVLVDLNVAESHADLNLLGVPDGWKAFCTRGYTERLDATDREFEIAQCKAGDVTPFFVVYGGGRAVKTHCQERGWLWIMEQRDVAKVVDGE